MSPTKKTSVIKTVNIASHIGAIEQQFGQQIQSVVIDEKDKELKPNFVFKIATLPLEQIAQTIQEAPDDKKKKFFNSVSYQASCIHWAVLNKNPAVLSLILSFVDQYTTKKEKLLSVKASRLVASVNRHQFWQGEYPMNVAINSGGLEQIKILSQSNYPHLALHGFNENSPYHKDEPIEEAIQNNLFLFLCTYMQEQRKSILNYDWSTQQDREFEEKITFLSKFTLGLSPIEQYFPSFVSSSPTGPESLAYFNSLFLNEPNEHTYQNNRILCEPLFNKYLLSNPFIIDTLVPTYLTILKEKFIKIETPGQERLYDIFFKGLKVWLENSCLYDAEKNSLITSLYAETMTKLVKVNSTAVSQRSLENKAKLVCSKSTSELLQQINTIKEKNLLTQTISTKPSVDSPKHKI